ncbi:MAG: hypothetical protein REI12_02505 [Pedobacter sp.]|nr:hypothetical protein [Pedobacter sp.]
MKKSRHSLFSLMALAAGVIAAMPSFVFSMSVLTEDELSYVSAQDGLTYNISAPAISATELTLDADTAANAGGIRASSLRMTNPAGGNMTASWVLDAGANVSGPAVSIVGHMDRYRLGGPTVAGKNYGYISALAGDTTRSFGEWALVSDMDFSLAGQALLVSGGKADLSLAYHDAALFWRQNYGHATLALSNINFLWKTLQGDISIKSEGLRLASAQTEFRIALDAYYKNNADQNMTNITLNDRPGIRFSWGGTLYDTVLFARSGGVWNTSSTQATNVAFASDGQSTSNLPTGRSNGVNLGMRWNYNSGGAAAGDFLWGAGNIRPAGRGTGDGSGDQEYLEFGDWRNLEQASGPVTGRYGFDIPMLVYDVLASGSATNAGGSLCWGNTMTGSACTSGVGNLVGLTAGTISGYSADVNRTGGALFMQLIRNGNLMAYSNRVRVKHIDDVTGAVVTDDAAINGGNADGSGYSWGLVSTMANINANIYFYPGGSESAGSSGRSSGAMGDLLFMSQSFDSPNFKNMGFDINNPDPTAKAAAIAAQAACEANSASTACNNARWSQGTHLLLADTGAQMGVGIIGASILLAADDMRLWLKDTTADTSPGNLTGGIDLFSPRVRYNLIGLLGGARLPNGRDLIRVVNGDMNLEGLLNFRLSSAPTNVQSGKKADSNDYLAYSGAIRLRCGSSTPFGCGAIPGITGSASNVFSNVTGMNIASGNGSYISMEEPGRAGVALRFDDLSGDLAMTEGVMQLRAASDDNSNAAPGSVGKSGTSRADITIANKILMGASAAARLTDGVIGAGVGDGGPAGRPLTGNIKFGGNDIMSMAIPAASAYYSLTIRAQ